MPESVPPGIESVLRMVAWWTVLTGVSAVGWLVLRPALASWQDKGWAIARGVSALAFAYAMWVAGHLAPVLGADAIRIIAMVAAIAVLACRRPALAMDRETWRCILRAELRFAIPFVLYATVRGFNHDVIGLEKFMDFAFVNAAFIANAAPVADPWFAGEPINYYYFGHFVTAFLAKLSATPPAYAYNLMLATLFASTFQLAHGVVSELDDASRRRSAAWACSPEPGSSSAAMSTGLSTAS